MALSTNEITFLELSYDDRLLKRALIELKIKPTGSRMRYWLTNDIDNLYSTTEASFLLADAMYVPRLKVPKLFRIQAMKDMIKAQPKRLLLVDGDNLAHHFEKFYQPGDYVVWFSLPDKINSILKLNNKIRARLSFVVPHCQAKDAADNELTVFAYKANIVLDRRIEFIIFSRDKFAGNLVEALSISRKISQHKAGLKS